LAASILHLNADLVAPSPPRCVLVVEHDSSTADVLRAAIEAEGLMVLEAPNVEAALRTLAFIPIFIIADLDLPAIDGNDLLPTLRKRYEFTPIAAISTSATEASIVRALTLGADAYLPKPFSIGELIARMRNLLRRPLTPIHEEYPLLHSGDLTLDQSRHLVKVRDQRVQLTRKEYQLLCILLQNAGKTLTQSFLLGKIWDRSTDISYLRALVRQLRKKIEADPAHPRLLFTVHTIGYRIPMPDAEAPKTRLLSRPEEHQRSLKEGALRIRAEQAVAK
jgi:two-component system, OmpR family, KDP operon response regulator KdpE